MVMGTKKSGAGSLAQKEKKKQRIEIGKRTVNYALPKNDIMASFTQCKLKVSHSNRIRIRYRR